MFVVCCLFVVCLFVCRYVYGWFFIDLFTSFPFEFLIHDNPSIGTAVKAFRVLRVLRIIKLLRFIKMLHLLNGLLHQLFSREFVLILRLCKFLFVIVIFGHFCACTWYAIGNYCAERLEQCHTSWLLETTYFEWESSNIIEKYSISWYWSVVTLMTTGYGDITATNLYEEWVASGCILVGTCFFAYFIGAVSGLLVDGDRVRAELSEKVEKAQQFCLFKKLPSDLSHAIITHTKYHCKNNFMFDEMSILNNLPTHLRFVFFCLNNTDYKLQIKKRIVTFLVCTDLYLILCVILCELMS